MQQDAGASVAKKPRTRPNASNQSFLKIRDQISQSSRSSTQSDPSCIHMDTLMNLDSLGSSVERSYSRDGCSSIREISMPSKLSSLPSPSGSAASSNVITAAEPTVNGNILTSLDMLNLQSQAVPLLNNLQNYSDEEVEYLTSLQLFAPFSERPDFFVKLKSIFQFCYYDPGAVIMEEAKRVDVHWIIKGTCSVTRNMKFINSNGVLSEYNPDLPTTKPIADVTIDTQELNAGDNTGTDSGCSYGIKTDTFVVTAKVSMQVLDQICTSQLKLMLDSSSSVYNFSNEFLIREYLEQAEYDRNRKAALSKTVDGNSLECLVSFTN